MSRLYILIQGWNWDPNQIEKNGHKGDFQYMDMRRRLACKNSIYPFLIVEANGFHLQKVVVIPWNATTTQNRIEWPKPRKWTNKEHISWIFLSFLWSVEIQIGGCKAGSTLRSSANSRTNQKSNCCKCQNEAELLASCILRVIHWRNPIDLGDASDAQPANQTNDMEFTCN